jgi:hypothetical protein
MSKLLLISGLLLAPFAATGQNVIEVYPDATLVSVVNPPGGQTALACYSDPLTQLPPICSIPDEINGFLVGDVEVYGVGGSSVKAVMQITTDENGNPLEQYFTPGNSAGPPGPQPTLLARLFFDGSGEADFFAGGVEFRLFDYAYDSGRGRPQADMTPAHFNPLLEMRAEIVRVSGLTAAPGDPSLGVLIEFAAGDDGADAGNRPHVPMLRLDGMPRIENRALE